MGKATCRDSPPHPNHLDRQASRASPILTLLCIPSDPSRGSCAGDRLSLVKARAIRDSFERFPDHRHRNSKAFEEHTQQYVSSCFGYRVICIELFWVRGQGGLEAVCFSSSRRWPSARLTTSTSPSPRRCSGSRATSLLRVSRVY